MITGIGLDVTEIEKIQSIHTLTSKFVERILTRKEIKKFSSLTTHRQIEFLAGRFAAKEAFAKA